MALITPRACEDVAKLVERLQLLTALDRRAVLAAIPPQTRRKLYEYMVTLKRPVSPSTVSKDSAGLTPISSLDTNCDALLQTLASLATHHKRSNMQRTLKKRPKTWLASGSKSKWKTCLHVKPKNGFAKLVERLRLLRAEDRRAALSVMPSQIRCSLHRYMLAEQRRACPRSTNEL